MLDCIAEPLREIQPAIFQLDNEVSPGCRTLNHPRHESTGRSASAGRSVSSGLGEVLRLTFHFVEYGCGDLSFCLVPCGFCGKRLVQEKFQPARRVDVRGKRLARANSLQHAGLDSQQFSDEAIRIRVTAGMNLCLEERSERIRNRDIHDSSFTSTSSDSLPS